MALRPFKGIIGAPRRSRKLGRTDAERRARMRAIDDASPIKPRRGDLIAGAAAQAELARIGKREQGRAS